MHISSGIRLSAGVLVLLGVSGGQIALAADATIYSKNCVVDANDPYDPGLEIASGPNQGKCLDASEERSVVLLEDAGKSLRFANFMHEGKYWIATLDPTSVDEVIFQLEYFPAEVPAGHTQMRLKLHPGNEIQLLEQAPAQGMKPETRSLREIAYSVQAVTTLTEPYDIVSGVFEHYGLAYRFVSVADRYRSMVGVDHHMVKQFNLQVSDQDKEKLIRNAVGTSAQSGMKYFYNTLEKSCITELFHLFDKTFTYDSSEKLKIFLGAAILDETYPPEAELALAVRGLLKPNHGSDMPDMDRDQALLDEIKNGY